MYGMVYGWDLVVSVHDFHSDHLGSNRAKAHEIDIN